MYTAPTAIRALHAKGDAYVTRYSRASLRLLGSVGKSTGVTLHGVVLSMQLMPQLLHTGEPINPEAWRWYHQVVGDGRCEQTLRSPLMFTCWARMLRHRYVLHGVVVA